MPGCWCFCSSLKLLYPLSDLLPGANAFVVAFESERADLLGNMESGFVTVGL